MNTLFSGNVECRIVLLFFPGNKACEREQNLALGRNVQCKGRVLCPSGHGPWALIGNQDPGILKGKVRVADYKPARYSFSPREL